MNSRVATLLGVLGVLAVLALLSRTNRGAVVVASVADAIATVARGLRNNNPGNVMLTSPPTAWVGWVGAAEQTDPLYVQMIDMASGVRMAARVFANYQRNYGLTSIAALIARWAPSSENDTAAYVADVADRVGVNAGDAINLADRDTMYAFLRAVFRHENGLAAELIPEATLYQGIDAA